METMRKAICKSIGIMVLFLAFTANAQERKMTAEEYIALFKDLAISEMKRTGIPASITLAQGLLESGNGNSALAKESNNHFGIKCKKDWTGRTVKYDDDAPQECFRAYNKAEDSYIDHSDFLVKNARYAALFQLEPTDYKAWASGLKQAGYATNPKYPELLISAIERFSLYQYDLGNTRKIQAGPAELFAKVEKKQELKSYNNIPAYVVKNGDTYASIAEENHMMRWQVSKYNDLSSNDKLQPGTILYLKPKKRKAAKEFHTVQEGESMYYISQANAIILKLLYKWNRMEVGQEPAPGEKLNLRKKRISAPKLREDKFYASEKRGIMVETPKPSPTIKGKTIAEIKENTKQVGEPKPYELKKEPVKESNPTLYVKEEKNALPAAETVNLNTEFHTVKEGETLQEISAMYNANIKHLQLWNDLSDASIYNGQLLRVKGEKNKPAESVKEMPDGNKVVVEAPIINGDFYSVQAGETLYAISRKVNVPVANLQQWNSLADNSLSVGQKLRIKPETEVKPEQQTLNYHEVQPGETLYSISRKYNISVEKLKAMNELTENTLSLGQKLKVKE